ncbi:TRAP transporter large permease subunit [Cohnella pontilimi]|uniref:TRAP transporter large permease subunit n=1 Tax=Cohnella pontilimi TaxID=2564100 RepID=A0A4U0F783_9BACL|nr:TRAP transporter large permease subunit [Cohnella pontilimi]TJY39844.1 TRAP transporter large permease subunit [Cohnella pontilimi]
MTLAIFVLSLLAVMALGIPVAFALLISAIVLMFTMGNFNTQILAGNLIDGADNFPLMAIPFFMLAGELMNAGGITRRIVNFAMAFVGHIRGGLGFVAIIASVIFAGISGSAVADTAALGAVLIPMMAAAGYNKNRSAGLIAGSGIIAPILPPSIPMIVFGVTAGVSISKLFLAGIVPGLLLALALSITWTWIARKEKVKVQPKTTAKEKWQATRDALWALIMPVIIIGGLRGGVFTPTEAAAVAAVYALFVGLFVYREIKLKTLYRLLIAAAKTSSVVMLLAAAAMVSSWLITVANIPAQLEDMLQPFMHNQFLLLMVINVIVLIVGSAMDVNPTIFILTPVLMPVITAAGIDPVYFGILFVLNNCIGLLTPPVGTVLNVAAGAGKISMDDIMKGVWPFLIVEIILLLVLTAFPGLVLVPLGWFH